MSINFIDKLRYLLLAALVGALAAACGNRSAGVGDPAALRFADQLQSIEQLFHAAGQDTGFGYPMHYANFVGGPPMLQA